MNIATATITYHTVAAPPPDNFEVRLLFHTEPGNPYLIQTTVDGVNWLDHGPITLPLHAQLSWPVDPKNGPWPRLVRIDK